jgi:pimeloyl-ACP methyl ester carboxylesterase
MKLHYQEYGSGHPLIILHGLFGSLDNWHTLSKTFGASHRVFALDQRNHGRSPHLETFTYQAMAEDLQEFIEHHRLPAAHILGHSMGGKTAMRFALSHPHGVAKLVVVDIAPRAYPPLHDEILSALLSLDLSRCTSRHQVDATLAAGVPDPTTRQFLLKNLSRDGSGAFRWKMNLKAIHEHYTEISQAVDSDRPFEKPTLFAQSARSGYILDSDRIEIRRLFPRAQIVRIEAGHWIHAEAPREFSRVVLDFLRNA